MSYMDRLEQEVPSEDLQADVMEFVQKMCRKTCDPSQYAMWLRDGKIILEVLRASSHTPLTYSEEAEADLRDEQRVDQVLEELRRFGVRPDLLFKQGDLLYKKNMDKVSQCLLEVKRLVYTGRGRARLSTTNEDDIKSALRRQSRGSISGASGSVPKIFG